MKTLHLACVVGARPNFMKMAPLLRALEGYPAVRAALIHTGQHYDANLSDIFVDELGIRRPAVSLDVGSGKHGVQTARILERLPWAELKRTPKLCIGYSDMTALFNPLVERTGARCVYGPVVSELGDLAAYDAAGSWAAISASWPTWSARRSPRASTAVCCSSKRPARRSTASTVY